MTAVDAAVMSLTAYATAGLLFALVFAAFGVQRVDPAARGAGLGFRLLVIPGAAAFWPLLLWKWMRSRP